MSISVKCRYGLKALFELALRESELRTSAQEIAEAQDIPVRFMGSILNRLRQGGFVESRRGKDGGFALARRPEDIVVADVIRFIDGPIYPVESPEAEPFDGSRAARTDRALAALWDEARQALVETYERHTLADLLEAAAGPEPHVYHI